MSKEEKLLKALQEKGLTLGSVESMTGGLFGAKICSVPGASKAYRGGLITYSAQEKIALLGLDPKLIETYGVVSGQVANEMAKKGAEKLGVDLCVSITGNAGPTAEPGEAPVGEMHISVASGDSLWSIAPLLKGERNEIREQAVSMMVAFVLSILTIVKN